MLARSTLLLTAPSGRRTAQRRSARNRAFDGIDNAAMSMHLAPADPFRREARRDLSDEQLFADYRRQSVTADSDTTSSAGRTRMEHEIPSTTPVGSYINGVLGGPRHPGLADDLDEPNVDDDGDGGGNLDDGDPEAAEAAADAAAAGAGSTRQAVKSSSFALATSDSVVRLRAENAKLVEMLHGAEQRLRQIEREKVELADKAVTLVEDLAEAKEELREERQLTASLRGQKEELLLSRRAHAAADGGTAHRASPTPSRTTLDGDLEQATRRVQSLERSMLEMKRRFAARQEEGGQPVTSLRGDDDAPMGPRTLAAEAATTATEAEAAPGPSLALAAGAMSQEISELRTSTEGLRRRMALQEERQKQQLSEAAEGRSSEKRAGEDALLAVALGLETAKAQNVDLRRQLDRSEIEKTAQGRRMEQLQGDYRQMRASASQTRQAWDEWAAQVEAGREELHRLGEANATLRDRLALFERSLQGLQRDLDTVNAEAGHRAERCQRLAADADRYRAEAHRARDTETKAAQLNAGMAKLLALADAKNRDFQRRLGVLAEAAQRSAAPELGRHLRELAGTVRTDFQVWNLSESDAGLSQKLDRLLSKLHESQERNDELELEVQRLHEEQQMAIAKLTECEAKLYLAKEVAGSGPEAMEHSGVQVHRQSHIQLAALIEQIDMVESRSDNLLLVRRRVGENGNTSAPPAPKVPPGLNGGEANDEQRTDVQRLMRMLLYNSKTA